MRYDKTTRHKFTPIIVCYAMKVEAKPRYDFSLYQGVIVYEKREFFKIFEGR